MTLAVRVDGLDYLSQLGRENAGAYTASAKTIGTIINELLALQVLTPAVTLGTINGTISAYTRSIQSDGWSILQVLQSLRETAGGYIEVDNDRHLNWSLTVGEDKGQQIRYRKNIEGFRRTIDFTTLANRIYAYGSGQGGARIALAAPGYIQDVPSQTLWGGIYAKSFSNQSFTIQATVTAWATQLLALYKTPLISYEINIANLALDTDFAFDELQLGSVVKVIDEDLGIDVSVKVTRIDYPDLMEPSRLVIQLSNRMRDLVDLLANVYETQQQQVAALIDGSQVISGNLPAAVMQTNLATALAASTATLDTLPDGVTYQRTKSVAIDANGMVILDQVVAGTYGLVLTTDISAGHLKLTSSTVVSGSWYDESGVEIDAAHGINIYGTNNALTTRATKTGTIQCYVGADGSIYAGAGAVKLNATGLYITGAVLAFPCGVQTAYVHNDTRGLTLASSTGIVLYPAGGDVVPFATNSYGLGNVDYYWAGVTAIYCALKETTTPGAVADFGKLYTKNDNCLYFQDGAGSEHTVTIS